MIWSAVLSLVLFGGTLPDGARLSVRFDPPRAGPGGKVALELSVTPPPGTVLLALMQPKSLGAPDAITLEPGPFRTDGPVEEPAAEERPERALQSQVVRYFPQSFGGTVAVRLPVVAPASFEGGRAELRGAVTLMFADEKTGKLTVAPSVPITATLEEDKTVAPPSPPPAPAMPPTTIILEAPPKQKVEPPAASPQDPPPPLEILAPAGVEPLPLPTQRWFLAGVAAGLLAVGAGPIGAYDRRKWWARWLGWRRLQGWTAVVAAVSLLTVSVLFPARSALPVLLGASAFGGMLFATGGGPDARDTNFLSAALRAQVLHGLLLSVAVLAKAACWDASGGFAFVFLARSCAPAVMPKVEEDECDDEEDGEEEPPPRKRSKRGRPRAA